MKITCNHSDVTAGVGIQLIKSWLVAIGLSAMVTYPIEAAVLLT